MLVTRRAGIDTWWSGLRGQKFRNSTMYFSACLELFTPSFSSPSLPGKYCSLHVPAVFRSTYSASITLLFSFLELNDSFSSCFSCKFLEMIISFIQISSGISLWSNQMKEGKKRRKKGRLGSPYTGMLHLVFYSLDYLRRESMDAMAGIFLQLLFWRNLNLSFHFILPHLKNPLQKVEQNLNS